MKLLQFAKIELQKKYKNNISSFKTAFSVVSSFLRQNPNLKDLSKDGEKILSAILNSKKSKETKRILLHIFAYLLERVSNNKKVHRKFIHAYTQIKSEIIEERKNNKPRSVKEAECLNISLNNLREKGIDMNVFTQKELLYNLLIFIDETPRLEWRMLVYNPKTDISQKNYIVCLEGRCQIILNKYKTSKTYGRWVIEIKDNMKQYLYKYIKQMNIVPNKYFFLNKRNKPYPSNKFSEHIQRMFKEKTGSPISINCLRKIKENALFHQNKKILNMSLKEREDYVKQHFRHSLQSSLLYYNRIKINPENNDNKYKYKEVVSSSENNVFKFMNELDKLTNSYGISKEQLKKLLYVGNGHPKNGQ